MEISTMNIPDFVKLANVIWVKGFKSVNQAMRGSGLVKVVPIAANSGNTREFSEIDTEEYSSRKDESDQAKRGKVQQGYTKTMYAKREAKDIGISYEMRTQNKYPEITATLTALGKLVPNRIDLDLSHRIGFGTATTYTDKDGIVQDISVGDTLALFSTAHTLKGSATTYRNILANNPRLSKGSLEGMERLFVTDTYNHFGETMSLTPDILFTTDDPNTVNTAREYLQSTAAVDGANAGITNVYAGKYKHVILPRLDMDANGVKDATKRYYWGLASSEGSTMYLGIWEEAHLKSPEIGSNAEEFSTDDLNFGVRGGYGIATVNGSWIKISLGTGQA